MVKRTSKLDLIQVLRGVASLLVMLYHASVNMTGTFKTSFFGNFFFFGNSGVDIFFVLSGFIITYTSVKGLGDKRKFFPFLRRRFVRIFPAYWVIIGVFLLIQVLAPAFYKSHYDFSPCNFLSTLFLLPGHGMVNGVSWTLTYELFFYLLFSLAFLLPNKKVAFIFSICYALFIITAMVSGYSLESGNKWSNLFIYPMNIEFVMGIIAAALVRKIPLSWSWPLIITGALIFLAGGVCIDEHFQLLPNSFNRVVIFGIPSFLIVVGIVTLELARPFNVHNILLLLGEASYSLYLLHLPILAASVKIISRLNINNVIMQHVCLSIIIIIICYISILFFKWIEKPMIMWLNALGKTKKL